MQTAVIGKLAKLVPMLSSNQPGEVAATARAIERTLKSAGADWHDLTKLLTDKSAEIIVDGPTTFGRFTDNSLSKLVEIGRQTIARLEAANDMERRESRRLRSERDSAREQVAKVKLDGERRFIVTMIANRIPQVRHTPVAHRASDRRAAVTSILLSAVGADLSDREIAKRVGCSPTTVGTIRRELMQGGRNS